jgi:hypothetical protein
VGEEEEERERETMNGNMLVLVRFLFPFYSITPSIWGSTNHILGKFPPYNPLWKCPHRYTQKCTLLTS